MARLTNSLSDIPVQPVGKQRSSVPAMDPEKNPDALFADIIRDSVSHNPNIDKPTLRRAYLFASERHKSHIRKSGDPYIIHSLEVTRLLADLRLDTQTLAAALLHDVVEDSETRIEEIEVHFGTDVALIVDGVTKLSAFKLRTREERKIDTFRKMLLSIAKDVRVILVKFADRLHNMRTLQHLSDEQQQRIAQETLDVYAPLAHRFGMARFRRELEDLAFQFVEPEIFAELKQRVESRRGDLSQHIDELQNEIGESLRHRGIECEVQGRIKHLYSTHRKMATQRKQFEEIYDLMAMRIVVSTIDECYTVMAYLHQAFRPMHGRFKDYLANPKRNGYQSLHTTVYTQDNRVVEVQIRTRRMHQVAEEGIARHWLYKEGRVTGDIDAQTKWVRQFLEWAEEIQDPQEFVDQLKIDLFPDEIFVQTPKGEVISLPTGGTALDFAFAVHTEVGLHSMTATVNGKVVALGHPLQSSDTVKITTAANQKPSRDWLSLVKTSKARSKIRRHLREAEFDFNREIGSDMLDRRLRKARMVLDDERWQEIAESFHVKDRDHLYAAVGGGDISLERVFDHLRPPIQEQPRQSTSEDITGAITTLALDDPMVRFAQCCNPVPGDPVFGFITRGRGLSVHHRECPNAPVLEQEPDRILEVAWEVSESDEGKGPFKTAIIVRAGDRLGALGEITTCISSAGGNIRHAEVRTEQYDGRMAFLLEVRYLRQLKRIISKLKRIPGVLDVKRVGSTRDEDELRALIEGLPLFDDDEEE
jgi:GTP diphosphokinase / guanosine-3',5'-bis(diphosphate) 3'-diphosphatase